LAMFVDDILLASRADVAITEVKQLFQSEFTMKFLGVHITQRPGELILDQEHYCRCTIRDFGKYIGSRNYTIPELPMQKDTALD
jgi:hypothetical protein